MERDNNERLKALKELKGIRDLIDEIEALWRAPFFDVEKAREIIQKVNDKHFENVGLYNLATYQQNGNPFNAGSGISIEGATQGQLQEDLRWKHFYLNAKLCGKAAQEIVYEWTRKRNG